MPVSASGRVLKVLVDNGRSSRRWLRVNVKLSHDALLAAHSAPNSLKASEEHQLGQHLSALASCALEWTS